MTFTDPLLKIIQNLKLYKKNQYMKQQELQTHMVRQHSQQQAMYDHLEAKDSTIKHLQESHEKLVDKLSVTKKKSETIYSHETAAITTARNKDYYVTEDY
jgi:septal ring factor EnvC (AmiA/AmiB activator)